MKVGDKLLMYNEYKNYDSDKDWTCGKYYNIYLITELVYVRNDYGILSGFPIRVHDSPYYINGVKIAYLDRYFRNVKESRRLKLEKINKV